MPDLWLVGYLPSRRALPPSDPTAEQPSKPLHYEATQWKKWETPITDLGPSDGRRGHRGRSRTSRQSRGLVRELPTHSLYSAHTCNRSATFNIATSVCPVTHKGEAQSRSVVRELPTHGSYSTHACNRSATQNVTIKNTVTVSDEDVVSLIMVTIMTIMCAFI